MQARSVLRACRCALRRRIRECGLGLLLLSALWLFASAPAQADATVRRVVLIQHGPDPFLERVGAEVEKLGFALVRSEAKEPLEAVARAEQALAALRVLPSRTGIEVWMADATSGRSLLRQLIVDESPTGPDRELIALQTAELLRTSLLGEKAASPVAASSHEQAQPAQSSEQPAPTTVPPELSAETREDVQSSAELKSTAAQLWCGVLYSPGGVRAALELGASLQRFFGDRWGLGVDLALPLWPGAISEVEGTATVGTYLAGITALARFHPTERFFATMGGGAALIFLQYRGDANDPLSANAGLRLAGAAYLRGDVGVVATSWLRFGLRALAGASLPRVGVTFAGNEVASFGPGLFAGFALAEVSFL